MKASALLRPKFLLGALFTGIVVLMALFGQLLTPYDANTQDLLASLTPPGFNEGGHLLGTDELGRDILARMISGARISLLIALCVAVLSGTFGTIVGALSGYWGGFRDIGIQKVVEVFWAFPPILLALAILTFLEQSLANLILALSIQRWIPYCRLSRAETMVLRSRDFVSASVSMGGGTAWIVRKHLLPNLYASTIVIATFSMATAILAEASLSFLGLGVPPSIPTWGTMLAEGRSYVSDAWWLAVLPGLGIFFTVLGLNLLGDWLRDCYDPKRYLNLR